MTIEELLANLAVENKKEIIASELSNNMLKVIEIAKQYTDNIPAVMMVESIEFTGMVNYRDYTDKVILISTIRLEMLDTVNRSEIDMIRTLAHELGHIIDGRNYQNASFIDCENSANNWKDIILSQL